MNRTMKWYIICTKPRWELKIFKALLEQGIEAYCPTYTSVRQWSDRRKKISKPYFNSYVFVRLEEAERDLVFGIPGVIRYVFWQGKAAIVRDEEIGLMREYLDGKQQGDIGVEHLKIGQEVTFTGGAFRSRKAKIEEIGQKKVLLVLPELGFRITTRIADLVP